jgi:hypothetical protein
LRAVKNKILPVIFVLVFALSRIPGLMPQNFSVAYAFMFCAGVFFPRRLAWWLPLATMLATDLGLLPAQVSGRKCLERRQPGEPGVQLCRLPRADFFGNAFQAAGLHPQTRRRRNFGRDFILSHHEHCVVAVQSISQY